MRPPKLGLIILILVGAAFGTYFLSNFFNQRTNSAGTPTSSIKLTSQLVSSTPAALPTFENFSEKNNTTKSLSDTLYQQLQKQIQNGNFASDVGSSSEKLANQVINSSLADLQLVSDIDKSELKISNDNSSSTKTQYLETIQQINQKDLAGFSENYLDVIVDTYQKLDTSSAQQVAAIYKNLAADYLGVSVPSDWLDIHKRLIIYAQNAEIIYRAMGSYTTDPIKGYLALEAIDALVNNVSNLQNIFSEKMKETGLK